MHEHLFVCGTLRSGFVPEEAAALMDRTSKVGEASVRGRLYDLGEFPAAILDPDLDTKIIGEVYRLPDDDTTLAELDAYEGIDPQASGDSMFVRRRAEVTLDNGETLECWIYVYNWQIGSATLITSGDYLVYKQERKVK
jgi:gamma-glutamylcyclotransferase (GGCT)/AIG2-like uncharacterized protein YtfP